MQATQHVPSLQFRFTPFGGLMLVSLLYFGIGVAGIVTFDQSIQQAAWIKLTRFSASMFSYAATMLWLVANIRKNRAMLRRWATAASAGGIVELFILFLQGVLITHYPAATDLVAELSHLARLAILVPTLFMVVAFKSVLSDRESHPVLKRSLLWATGLALLGCIPGAIMLLPEYSISPIKLTADHYSALKLSHFIGLHCLQLLPLSCWLVRRQSQTERSQLESITFVGITLFLLIVLLLLKGLLPIGG